MNWELVLGWHCRNLCKWFVQASFTLNIFLQFDVRTPIIAFFLRYEDQTGSSLLKCLSLDPFASQTL